ncbi:MAG: hypothetical protein P9M14_02880 [Candidatus Alcyoniella australis]|nr:hypothetical protein [Candidatus Alcyoniella australis]
MDDNRIDFSSLDPLADPNRFERSVRAVMAGVTQATDPHPLLNAISYIGRRVVLATGMAAISMWILMFLALNPVVQSGKGDTTMDPVEMISTWAEADSIPLDVDVLQVMELLDAR